MVIASWWESQGIRRGWLSVSGQLQESNSQVTASELHKSIKSWLDSTLIGVWNHRISLIDRKVTWSIVILKFSASSLFLVTIEDGKKRKSSCTIETLDTSCFHGIFGDRYSTPRTIVLLEQWLARWSTTTLGEVRRCTAERQLHWSTVLTQC